MNHKVPFGSVRITTPVVAIEIFNSLVNCAANYWNICEMIFSIPFFGKKTTTRGSSVSVPRHQGGPVGKTIEKDNLENSYLRFVRWEEQEN